MELFTGNIVLTNIFVSTKYFQWMYPNVNVHTETFSQMATMCPHHRSLSYWVWFTTSSSISLASSHVKKAFNRNLEWWALSGSLVWGRAAPLLHAHIMVHSQQILLLWWWCYWWWFWRIYRGLWHRISQPMFDSRPEFESKNIVRW